MAKTLDKYRNFWQQEANKLNESRKVTETWVGVSLNGLESKQQADERRKIELTSGSEIGRKCEAG